MTTEKEARDSFRQAKRLETAGKYKPLPRNKQTEEDLLRIFQHGTEEELSQFLRESGLSQNSSRSREILRLFRWHAGKRL